MKHLEEKILAYLDGSLADTEREEVLRDVSASPEGRRMLEEHLRVGSLLTQAAKPTSAPLDAQRALASKLPMMATYLPYLAPQSARKTVGAWYRSTKYVTAMIGGAAVIGGALWFALSNSNSSSESHSLAQRLPLAAEHGLVQPNNTQPQTTGSNPIGNTPHEVSRASNGLNRSNISHTFNSSNPSSEQHTRARSELNAHSGSNAIRTRLAQASEQPAPKAVEETLASHAPHNAANVTEQNAPEMPPLHSVSVSNAAAQRDTHYEIPHFIAERQAAGYIPLRGFLNFKKRSASLTEINPTKHITDSGIGYQGTDLTNALEAELAYEVSPWVSVGLRGGQANFYRLQEHSYSVSSGDLVRTYNDAYLDRVTAPWLGVSVRYEFNPEDKVRLAATGVGGAAFIPGATSPMASLELSGTYSIWSFLALEAAASVDGSRVKPSYQEIDANKPGVIGYVTTGPVRTTITTTAFGGRVGLVFHP